MEPGSWVIPAVSRREFRFREKVVSYRLLIFVFLVMSCFPLRAGEDEGEPELLRGPYLQGLNETSVEVIWLTSEAIEGRIRCVGPDERILEVTGPLSSNHRLRLDGLSPASRYSYSIYSGEDILAQGDHLRFRTAPPAGEGTLRAVVVGDSGTGSVAQARVGGVMEGLEPDLFLHTGDLIYSRSLDSAVFLPYRNLLSGTCFIPSRGNHDFNLARMDLEWRDVFTVPNDDNERTGVYYSYDWGPAHFTVLDYIFIHSDFSAQLEFIEQDLAAARQRGVRWLIIYQHLPIYTAGSYANYSHPIRQLLPELCDRYGVDLVLSGHDHNYQRSYPVRERVLRDGWQDPVFERPRGTVYIVTGGGGGVLYGELDGARDRSFIHTFQSVHHCVVLDISAGELRTRALDSDGELVDEFRIRKQGLHPSLPFLRGDANLDGTVDIGDAIMTLGFLFLGESLPCPAAADSTGEGIHLVITRPIYTLRFLFMGGPPPPDPFPFCEPAAGADDAFCYEVGC